jgi:hypothetical protein
MRFLGVSHFLRSDLRDLGPAPAKANPPRERRKYNLLIRKGGPISRYLSYPFQHPIAEIGLEPSTSAATVSRAHSG